MKGAAGETTLNPFPPLIRKPNTVMVAFPVFDTTTGRSVPCPTVILPNASDAADRLTLGTGAKLPCT